MTHRKILSVIDCVMVSQMSVSTIYIRTVWESMGSDVLVSINKTKKMVYFDVMNTTVQLAALAIR